MAVIKCQRCGESVTVIEPSNVRTGHTSSGDERRESEPPREWVIYECGAQLHHCAWHDGRSAAG